MLGSRGVSSRLGSHGKRDTGESVMIGVIGESMGGSDARESGVLMRYSGVRVWREGLGVGWSSLVESGAAASRG